MKTPQAVPEHVTLLAVITPKHTAEVERILSHTRWQTHFVSSIHDAMQALKSLRISVVLCEERLTDGTWLDVVCQTEQLHPPPKTIVVSANPDRALWAEVLNCGGYDLLAIPLQPQDLYAIIPLAWRQCVDTPDKNSMRESANPLLLIGN